MILFDQPSFQSLLLEARFGDEVLGSGTGFVVEFASSAFLVTNWHVVTGRRPGSGEIINKMGAVPDRILVHHNATDGLGMWVPKVEFLYEDGRPRWREHPIHGTAVDVVALPLADLAGTATYPYESARPMGHDAANLPAMPIIGPSDFVNIVGFPFGWTAGGLLGIWVQGAIASEPQVDFRDLPCFLIDSRTRPGQSGSPVIFYQRSGWLTLPDRGPFMHHNPLTILLGVYSGRLSSDSDLGTVWKASVIAELLGSV